MSENGGFLDNQNEAVPHAFLQWRGTNACFDFYCECGAHCHFDGDFANAVECPHCDTIWEMPCILYPRKACDKTYPGHIEMAKTMDRDEDYSGLEGDNP